jgi:Endoribonuclease L-PSP
LRRADQPRRDPQRHGLPRRHRAARRARRSGPGSGRGRAPQHRPAAREAGTDKTKLLTANVWLADIRNAEIMNEVWEAWVPDDCAPARATIESRLPSPLYALKVAVTAAR